MRSLKYEYISSYGQRRNIILKTAHWYGLNFLYVFIRTENLNLKFSENLADLTFLREKVSTFAESKWYVYTLWLLITLCNMPKGLQHNYQVGSSYVYICCMSLSWAMWVYNTTQVFPLVSCYWYKGCNIISDTLKKICISFVLFSFRYVVEWKLFQNVKGEAGWIYR